MYIANNTSVRICKPSKHLKLKLPFAENGLEHKLIKLVLFPDEYKFNEFLTQLDFIQKQHGCMVIKYQTDKLFNIPFLCQEKDRWIRWFMAEVMLHLPKAKENLKHYFSNADMTCAPMKWYFLARVAAFEKDEELMDDLQCEIHAHGSARTPDKHSEAWVYDALGYITRSDDFDSTKKIKDKYHDAAIALRKDCYEGASPIDQIIILYEIMKSWQSRGYANAHIGTNGSGNAREKLAHLKVAKSCHRQARLISEEIHAKIILQYSREQFSQSDIEICLDFDGMLRELRLKQTQDLMISKDPFNCEEYENVVQNCVDRISYNLSSSKTRDATELKCHLEEIALKLKEDVARGEIDGILLNHPACSE